MAVIAAQTAAIVSAGPVASAVGAITAVSSAAGVALKAAFARPLNVR